MSRHKRDRDRGDDRWMTEGACLTLEDAGDLYFGENGRVVTVPAVCRQTCGRCPVLWECLAYALRNKEEHGVWGGLSPRERRQPAEKRAAIIDTFRDWEPAV